MISLDTNSPDFLKVTMEGQLTHADYQKFAPQLDECIKAGGHNCLLIDATRLEGWDVQAGWDDFKLGVKHRNDFDKIALVGNKTWEEYMAKFSSMIMSGEVKFFSQDNRQQAESWLKE